jgi:G6PDH family F420-dependent oxidoreductase
LSKQIKIGIDIGENIAEPRQFIESAMLVDDLGFDSVWFGDHFLPWVHNEGKSGFIWSLIASSLERTARVKIGPDVTCPIGGRFHPAIVAQAAATLDNMYPGRFLLGVGSGEAVNEARFFQEKLGHWPAWKERIERLAEATALMRKLWSSEDYFDFQGRFFKMPQVMLYTKPKTKIPIYFSAMGAKAATYAGRFGDHLITIASLEKCKHVIFPNFEEGVRMEGKDPLEAEKMVLILFEIGDPEQSLKRLKAGGASFLTTRAFDNPDPRNLETSTSTVDDSDVKEYFHLCRTADDLIDVAEQYSRVGATHIVFETEVNPKLIKMLGETVLPSLNSKR